MKLSIRTGDVLQVRADALISTANPWLNLSGGVNGAILQACGSGMQITLHQHLKSLGTKSVPAGTVVHTDGGDLPATHVLHAVAIDPFYDSSVELVRQTMTNALQQAIQWNAQTVASPTLATGYGPLSIADFGHAIEPLIGEKEFDTLSLILVVRTEEHRNELTSILSCDGDA